MLVVVGGDFAEELEEEFLVVGVFGGGIEYGCDEFGDFGREGGEGLGVVDCEVDQFFGRIARVAVVRIEYFLY